MAKGYYDELVGVKVPRKLAIKLKDILAKNPTADVVEVVRCGECKYLKVFNGPTIYAFCPKIDFAFEPFQTDTRTHFCSYGEKKE